MESKPACKSLVLDAGPLLSLSPLRGLAERFLTVPQVLSELKDKNAREHFERLGLSAGIKIEVREPDAASLSQVIQSAKRTGDYSVLSHADLCVIALTHSLDKEEKLEQEKNFAEYITDRPSDDTQTEPSTAQESSKEEAHGEGSPVPELPAQDTNDGTAEAERIILPEVMLEEGAEELHASCVKDDQDDAEREPLDVILESIPDTSALPQAKSHDSQKQNSSESQSSQNTPLFDDPSDEDDGEGEWITPDNVDTYKSRALDLFPSAESTDPFTSVTRKKGRGKGWKKQNNEEARPRKQLGAACMTSDFAMQNVLLQMGLNLVGIEGKRIEKVKTWVLRCHACFKVCKDSSKKFCPSCGNPSLLRASVTIKSPTADESSPAMEVHLKKNFQYRTRGTIYSIPAPKPGSSKKGSGDGLILREDQSEYMRATKRTEGQRQREEKRLVQQTLAAADSGNPTGLKLGSWMDPDWVPEMLSVGIGGKGRRAPDDGRTPIGPDGMPVIGYGRKNPNERRRKK